MKPEVTALLAALGSELPPLLDATVDRLERSHWPEVTDRWSRLTPSGFPIEITVVPGTTPLRWTAEVAGPEVAETQRLGLTAEQLATHGPAVDPALLTALLAGQNGVDLRFGAWIGGREPPEGSPLLKLYAELPPTVDLTTLGLPEPLVSPCRWLPPGTAARMLGVEPGRRRVELYLRLPAGDLHDLATFLHVTGHGATWTTLNNGLVDGLARLAGRRLGVSIACAEDEPPEIALFVSARTLFPTGQEMLAELAPVVATVDQQRWRVGPVTLGLDPTGQALPVAVGFYPHQRQPPNQIRSPVE